MAPVCLIGEGRTLVAIYSPCLGTGISLINPHGFIDAGLSIDKQTPTRCVLELWDFLPATDWIFEN